MLEGDVLPMPISPILTMLQPFSWQSSTKSLPTARACWYSSSLMADSWRKFLVPRAILRLRTSPDLPQGEEGLPHTVAARSSPPWEGLGEVKS